MFQIMEALNNYSR